MFQLCYSFDFIIVKNIFNTVYYINGLIDNSHRLIAIRILSSIVSLPYFGKSQTLTMSLIKRHYVHTCMLYIIIWER